MHIICIYIYTNIHINDDKHDKSRNGEVIYGFTPLKKKVFDQQMGLSIFTPGLLFSPLLPKQPPLWLGHLGDN